jgi:hypothetical protein
MMYRFVTEVDDQLNMVVKFGYDEYGNGPRKIWYAKGKDKFIEYPETVNYVGSKYDFYDFIHKYIKDHLKKYNTEIFCYFSKEYNKFVKHELKVDDLINYIKEYINIVCDEKNQYLTIVVDGKLYLYRSDIIPIWCEK